MSILFIVISVLLVFLLGYVIGKRQGWAAGCQETEAVMPLKIRQQSLEEGKCIICSEHWTKMFNYEKISRDLDIL
ncbi:hypothetical protein SCACP_17360 [Sporomusa carbonis]|uniref:hypothetical protein n=1 Tax=Sporomusa carbonis TaxID=3076075 RepID=UPI003A6EE595